MKVTLTNRRIGHLECVAISGSLTAADTAVARQHLLDRLEQGDGKLVLDLSELNFCDSSGLSVLISALKAARAQQGDVALAGLTPPIRALIELTRLQQVFQIFDNAEQAAVEMR
ncbi:anti-anti-sigma factor [Thiocapsa imhoffii]|uniref:Anti-sigma factor antagonist n=1 Tax=Thiocapsa imhoffii TaxID=382777 RepID=A0A9X1B7W9_9GAMM|nr:STAS domain-containing protein [Thiocapsa imhoffii]MBK1643668.1 anti-anti-sigma factor [Thiocapsa imhoffii]